MKSAKNDVVIQVPLHDVSILECVEERHQLLSDPTFLLQAIERITPAAIELLLKMHPILAIQRRRKIFCVSGFRVLNIATVVLGPETPVPVRMLPGLSEAQATELALADLFLTPLVFSVAGAETIDTIRQHAGNCAAGWTDLATCPLNQLSKALGKSVASLYYNDRKKRKSGP